MKRSVDGLLVGGTMSLLFLAGTAFYHALLLVAVVKLFRYLFG